MESLTPESNADEFYIHAASVIAARQESLIPEDVDFTLEQQVAEDGRLVGHYHLHIHAGHIAVMPGPPVTADITLRQDAATARSLQDGSMHAQGASLTGKLSIDGDINKLLEHGPLLADLLGTTAGNP